MTVSADQLQDGVVDASLAKRMLTAAWLGVLLGLILEAILLGVAAWQSALPAPIQMAADTVQKLSWSSLICAALVAGQTIAKKIALSGISGLITAPFAFLAARSLHKATLSVLGVEAAGAATQWLAAGIKGVEYALLGVAIHWLSNRAASWKAYAGVGAYVGMSTYVLTYWLLPASGNPLQRALVETLHPVGCALAVHVTMLFQSRMASSTSNA